MNLPEVRTATTDLIKIVCECGRKHAFTDTMQVVQLYQPLRCACGRELKL